MRNLVLEGNTAGGAPSSIGFRYSTANLYDVHADGQIYAQRHRVRQSGSKHGGARRVFSRPLTPLVTKFLGSSSSAD